MSHSLSEVRLMTKQAQRLLAARQPDLTVDVQEFLLEDRVARRALCYNPTLHPRVQETLSRDEEYRLLLASHPNLVLEVADRLARDASPEVRRAVAAATSSLTLQEGLLEDVEVVSHGLGQNPSLDRKVASRWSFLHRDSTFMVYVPETSPLRDPDLSFCARTVVWMCGLQALEALAPEVDGEFLRSLALGWTGSVQELVDAARLVSR